MFYKIIILMSFICLNINASMIIIDNNTQKLNIIEFSEIYLDKNSKESFEEIRKKEFLKITYDYIKQGYTNKSIWLKFTIQNTSNKNIKKYLTITNPMLDTIVLYTKAKNFYKKETQGVMHLDLYDRNNILHPSFKINFKKNEIKEFYYKTHSLSSANYFKLFIKNEKTLYKDEFSYQLIETLFFGAMLALIIYNIFIFIFTKNLSYFYYILYIFFVTWNHSSYSIMADYIYPTDYIYIEAYLAVYYLSFANIFSLLFIREILGIKKYKKLNSFFIFLLVLNIFIIILSTKNSYLISYSSLLILITMIFLFFVCIYSYIQKHEQSKYVLLGWSINLVGIFMLILLQFGFYTIIDEYTYFYELTVFLEAILFSVALASRVNKNKELQTSVNTNKILTKELHHRVKNNMQFIILMYRLKLSSFITKDLDEKLKETEGSIQAISKTHEILYQEENLEYLNAKNFFTNLIEEFKKAYNTSLIKIKLDIVCTIDVNKAIYCGIILNELLTNSLKYAFKNNKGEIDISLKYDKNKYIFIIKDNGEGFNYKEKKDESFGLSFIEAIVKDELNGKINIINNNGIKNIISWENSKKNI